MISPETAASYLAEYTRNAEKDSAYSFKHIAEFSEKEPCIVALIANMFATGTIVSPTSAAIIAVSIYEKLRCRQIVSDKLKEDTT